MSGPGQRSARGRRRAGHAEHVGEAHGHTGARDGWWWRHEVRVVAVVAAAAFALGVSGYDATRPLDTWQEIAFPIAEGLHVFTAGFPQPPTLPDDEFSAPLFAGQLLGHLVVLYATLRLVAALFSDRLAAIRARRRRDHGVVCGLGAKGARVAEALAHERTPAVGLDLDTSTDGPRAARATGATVLQADASASGRLAGAGIDRARILVCCCPDDGTNERIAAAALARRPPSAPPLEIWIHVEDAELVRLLRASNREPGVHYFCVYDVWARRMLEPLPDLRPGGTTPPRLVVVGAGPLAAALVVTATRSWHVDARASGSDERLEIRLVDEDATAAVEALVRRYPAIERTATLVPVDTASGGSGPELLAELGTDAPPPAGVLVALPDQAAVLAVARIAADRLRGRAPVIAGVGSVLERAAVHPPAGVVAVEPWRSGTSVRDLLEGLLAEAGGRAVHEAYRAGELRRGRDLASWSALPERLRASSRDHFDAIPRQLAAVWYRLAPLGDWDAELVRLTPAELDVLARLEHARWCDERRGAGWREGPRDDESRTHPDLVAWAALPQRSRAIDLDLAAAWPQVLGRMGLGLERHPAREAVAREVHERYRATRAAAGETIDEWDVLPESGRARSLAFADGIPATLLDLGLAIAAEGTVGAKRLELRAEAVERLAEREHERWHAQRADDGWRTGPHDAAGRTHPDMVPWAELADDRRELDRVLVRALPELLAAAGVRVVAVGPEVASEREPAQPSLDQVGHVAS